VLQTILDDLVPVLDNIVKERADFMIGKLPYTALKPNLLKIAQGITGAGQRISDIVAALKDFVRPDDPANLSEPVDVNEVVRKALDLMAVPIRKSTHRFAVVYGENLPKLPKGRARKIEQVVINLLMNACQALSGPDKAVRIVTGHDPDTKSLVITVTDEGCGMPANLIARIKDPFFTTKRSKGGTGLGLSISDAIIREHHGRLEFTSQEGSGTTARVVLPLTPAVALEES
jgi:polar amino acid transport system substrate-binding protein